MKKYKTGTSIESTALKKNRKQNEALNNTERREAYFYEASPKVSETAYYWQQCLKNYVREKWLLLKNIYFRFQWATLFSIRDPSKLDLAIYWSPMCNTIVSFIKSQSKLYLNPKNIPKIGSQDCQSIVSHYEWNRRIKNLFCFLC